jgi:hypothetical protein
VIAAMLGVADSRFQDDLMPAGQDACRVCRQAALLQPTFADN